MKKVQLNDTYAYEDFITDEEQEEWEAGGDPCQVVLKIKE